MIGHVRATGRAEWLREGRRLADQLRQEPTALGHSVEVVITESRYT